MWDLIVQVCCLKFRQPSRGLGGEIGRRRHNGGSNTTTRMSPPSRGSSRHLRCPGTQRITTGMSNYSLKPVKDYVANFGSTRPCRSRVWPPPSLRRVNLPLRPPLHAQLSFGLGRNETAVHQDGTSGTVLLSEVLGVDDTADGRGAWIWNGMGGTCFTTRNTPNSSVNDKIQACASSAVGKLACVQNQHGDTATPAASFGDLWASARSDHEGGVNAALADGSVRYITDSIDPNVWKALGTKSGGEPAGDF